MIRAISWFARNPVAANLLMFLIIIGGLSAVPAIKQQVFPDLEINVIQIGVPYLGASPEEVEEGVCIRIEEELQGADGIERITSTANEGACAVMAELLTDYPIDRALAEIKNAIDSISTFPDEIEKPVISHFRMRSNTLQVAVSGDADEKTRRFYAERVRDGIAALPEVTQVGLANARNYEISIELPESSLRRHGLTFDHVVRAIRRSSLDLPGGEIKTSSGEVLLRAKGQAYRGADFEEIVVLTREDGTRLRLGDIATVVDGFEEGDRYSTFNGEPASLISVERVGDQKVLDVAGATKAFLAQVALRLPEGVDVTVWRDDSVYLEDRLSILLRNARGGFILVFVVLALFLRMRLAIWVAVGVPVSILGALWMFPAMAFSIDVLTLFAFILVLGLLVDDAIVVGENVHTHQERAEDPLAAAIRGTQEVSIPVIFGVLTTVAAFLPMILAPGSMGAFFGTIGMVVCFCLAFSVIESQLVLPSHLGHQSTAATVGLSVIAFVVILVWMGAGAALVFLALGLFVMGLSRGWFSKEGAQKGRKSRVIRERWKSLQNTMATSLTRLSRRGYRPLLARAIEWRYVTVSIAVVLLLLTLATIGTGRLRWTFFPRVESDFISAMVTMPPGTPITKTGDAVAALRSAAERVAVQLDEQFGAEGMAVKHMMASVGGRVIGDSGSPGSYRGSGASPNLGEVSIELIGGRARKISPAEMVALWRAETPPIPGVDKLVYKSDYFSFGDPIDVELKSANPEQLASASEDLKQHLAGFAGVYDIADSFQQGKREMKLNILPAAEALGLTLDDLARQVRQAFYGEEAQRVQRGREDIRVMVRYPEEQRRSLSDLENLRIRTPSGGEVPFYAVAEVDEGRGYSTIRRVDRERVISVTANVDLSQGNPSEILRTLEADFVPGLIADYPDVTYSLEGEQREQRMMMGALIRDYGFALVLIYALLAIPLRSYGQPLIIMSVIPFGLVGAIAGHLIMDMSLSMMSVFGVVALSGVLVNSSLVLVHSVNRRRSAGATTREAVEEAGTTRFRPIVLTSVTTFVGLAPLLLEPSMGAQFVIPMAVSMAFGVLFASLLSLFLVPCGYIILEDLIALLHRSGGSPSEKSGGASVSTLETPVAAMGRS